MGWLAPFVITLLALTGVRHFLVDWFVVPSESMQQLLQPGDRIVVDRLHGSSDLHRGDVIVFDGTDTFGGQPDSGPAAVLGRLLGGPSGTFYVKRLIGLPGDEVKCCTVDGKLSVNGTALTEPYIYPGASPSDIPFDVKVPAGKVWVMGDHRNDSADSRAHMGDPGGGFVPLSDVAGRVTNVVWPLSSLTSVPSGATLPTFSSFSLPATPGVAQERATVAAAGAP